MTIADKIKSLFSKKTSKNALSIVMQPSMLSYCYAPRSEPVVINHIAIVNDHDVAALTSLHNVDNLSAACELILSPQHYQIVQTDKPQVPEEELLAALIWQVKDLISISPNDLVLDYFDGPMIAGIQKVNVVCAAKSRLKQFVHALHKDKLEVSKITTEEFAFAKLLTAEHGPQLLICQQPQQEIIILIVQHGMLYSFRRLRGMANIGQRSEQELSMGTIDNLSIEIQKSMDFFERQLKQPPVKQINVLLPVENEAFIARKLAENTHLPVELIRLPEAFPNDRAAAVLIGNMQSPNLSLENNEPVAEVTA